MKKLNNIIKKAFSSKNYSQKEEKLLIATKITHRLEIQNIKLVMVLWKNRRTDEKFETFQRQSFFLQHPQIFSNTQEHSLLQSDSIRDNLATFKIFAIFLGNYYLVTFKSPPNKMMTFKNLIIRKLPTLLELMNLDEQIHTQFYQGQEPSKMYRLDFLLKKVKQADRAVLPFVNGQDKAKCLIQMSKCNFIKLEDDQQPIVEDKLLAPQNKCPEKDFLKGLGLEESAFKKICQILNQNQRFIPPKDYNEEVKKESQYKMYDSLQIEERKDKELLKKFELQATHNQFIQKLSQSESVKQCQEQHSHNINNQMRDEQLQEGEIIEEQQQDEVRKLIEQ